jgi:hypothetical protein
VRGRARRALLAALAAGGVALAAGRAAAEPFLDGFSGVNRTQDADVRFRQPAAGSDFTVHDLAFAPRLGEGAPYYGVRAGYFFREPADWLGVALEFFHFKIVAETGDTRRVSGTLAGAPIDARLPVDALVQRFSISNGVSYVMLDVIARHGLFRDPEDFPHGRLQLYAGIGGGPVVTYTYSTIGGARESSGYQLGGGGGQAFAGVRLLLFRHVGLFVEGKYTYTRLTVDVAGGEAELTERGPHLVGGLTLVWR